MARKKKSRIVTDTPEVNTGSTDAQVEAAEEEDTGATEAQVEAAEVTPEEVAPEVVEAPKEVVKTPVVIEAPPAKLVTEKAVVKPAVVVPPAPVKKVVKPIQPPSELDAEIKKYVIQARRGRPEDNRLALRNIIRHLYNSPSRVNLQAVMRIFVDETMLVNNVQFHTACSILPEPTAGRLSYLYTMLGDITEHMKEGGKCGYDPAAVRRVLGNEPLSDAIIELINRVNSK